MSRSDFQSDPGDLRELVTDHLRSAKSSWNIGAFGAIAEFHRQPSEAADVREFAVVTAGGAIAVRLEERCRANSTSRRRRRAPARTSAAARAPGAVTGEWS